MLGIGLWLNGGGAGFARGGPSIQLSALTVAEDAIVTDVVGTATAPGTTGTPTWSLTDNAAGQFAINSSTGVVTVAGAIAGNSDTITISVSGLTPAPPDRVFTINTILAAPILDLLAASDTGALDDDNISTDTTPTLAIDFSALTGEGATIRLYNDDVLVTSHVLTAGEAAGGSVELQLSALGAGTHPLTVTADNGNGESPISNELAYVLDLTPPTILSFTPADNATAVAVNATTAIVFSETIVLNPDSLSILFKEVGGATIEAFDQTDIGVALVLSTTTVLNDTLTITHAAFANSTSIAGRITFGSITDVAGNVFAGIADDTTWNFSTTSSVPALAELALITDAANVALGNTYNGGVWSGVSLGTAHANRLIVAIIKTSGTGATISAVTIGGVSATSIENHSSTQMQMFAAAVPTGATGDIVISIADATATSCDCKLYAIYPASATKVDSGQGTALTTSPAVVNDLEVVAGGYVIYGTRTSTGADGREMTTTWTGPDAVNEVYDARTGESLINVSFGHILITASSTTDDLSSVLTTASTTKHNIAGSWGPP